MSTNAYIKGWTFEIETAAATFSDFSEVTEVSGLGASTPLVDVTHFASTAKEYIGGLSDGSEISVTCNFLANDTVQDALTGAGYNESGATFGLKFTTTDGTNSIVYTFDVVNLGYEITPAIDDKNSIAFTFKISGAITAA
tara:strand:- start:8817 stop:9236 length:420 start_codon:yes stop_codon:yes gene_type:complete